MKQFIKRIPGAISVVRWIRSTPPPLELPPIERTPLTASQISELLQKENPTIIEIGTNSGMHTVTFLEAMPTAKLYCFEPDRRAAIKFRNTIGDDSRVSFFECAVSSTDGEAEFHVSSGQKSERHTEEWDESGSLRKPKEHLVRHPWCKFEETVQVKTVSLDNWGKQQEVLQADFIWMDAQGAEADVFLGGKKLLSNTKFLYTEYDNREMYEGQSDLRSLLSLLPNFKVLKLYPKDILLENISFQAGGKS